MIIHGNVVIATPKAVKLRFFKQGEGVVEKWVPRSVITDGEKIPAGYHDDFEIADWFCEKEGIQ